MTFARPVARGILRGVAVHFTIPAPNTAKVRAALAFCIAARDLFSCQYCGAANVVMQVDHVTPRAHFAASVPARVVNAPTNLVAACLGCNAAKGPQDLAGFARMLVARGVAPAKVAAMQARVTAATVRALP